MIERILLIIAHNCAGRTSTHHPHVEIAQRWVETGDQRCPLACVWLALSAITSDLDDEPQRIGPSFSSPGSKAGRLHSIHILIAPSTLAHCLRDSILTIAALLLLTISLVANAQDQDHADGHPGRATTAPKAPTPEDDVAPTMFPHPEDARYLITGQANIIFQAHGPFHSPYEGTNSLLGRGEYKASLLGTLYLGAQLRRDPKTETDVLFNLE